LGGTNLAEDRSGKASRDPRHSCPSGKLRPVDEARVTKEGRSG
jgi:hypothetical protein